MKAIVKNDLVLLGTDIKFKKGEIVEAIPATNLPKPNAHKFFIYRKKEGENKSMLVNTPTDIHLYHGRKPKI